MLRIMIIIILFGSSFCFADLYYWTDENGVKHITDRKPAVGAENFKTITESVHKQQKKADTVSEPDTFRDRIKPDVRQKKTVKYRQNKEVVMYSTQKCGYCRRAKSFFEKNSIRYTEYDVGSSKQALKKFKALNGKGVPLIYIGNQRISGFDEPLIRKALGLK